MEIKQNDTPATILRALALQNRGADNFFRGPQLEGLLRDRGVEPPERARKSELYDLLAEHCSLEELERIGGMGLPSLDWQRRFGITGAQVRKLARRGVMRRTGMERVRRYGKCINCPLYSVIDFFRLADEEVRKALEVRK